MIGLSLPSDLLARFDAARHPGQTRSGLLRELMERYLQEVAA